ncbi:MULTISPECIES: hypothetical protein [Nitrosopumilus]|nr:MULTISPECIES: hypothetical protein [Nitrosopumilus]
MAVTISGIVEKTIAGILGGLVVLLLGNYAKIETLQNFVNAVSLNDAILITIIIIVGVILAILVIRRRRRWHWVSG